MSTPFRNVDIESLSVTNAVRKTIVRPSRSRATKQLEACWYSVKDIKVQDWTAGDLEAALVVSA